MTAADFLQRMAAASRQRVDRALAERPEAEVARLASAAPPAARLRLSPSGFDLIAEVKRRSPSAGELAMPGMEPAEQARRYVDGGAAALSVLTEPEEFNGDLAHLEAVSRALPGTPAMRKDFLVSTYQVLEARAAGAAGVLLIAASLDPGTLAELLQATLALGMFALVEVFDRQDLERCLPVIAASGPPVIDGAVRTLLGVNCRDLRSLAVDFARFAELAPHLPPGLPTVAESGVETPAQAAAVAGMGYRLALVGSALMRAADAGQAVRDLLAAGREQLSCS